MRRDGTMTVVNVKTERTSSDGRAEKSKSTEDKENEPELERPVRVKKEKVDEPIVLKSTATRATTNKTATRATQINESKKTTHDDSNDSLEIVPMDTNPTIELSDDENTNDGNKMPPPAFVPPIKPIKEKKITPVEKKTTRSTRSKQPRRKVFLFAYSFSLENEFFTSCILLDFLFQGLSFWGIE